MAVSNADFPQYKADFLAANRIPRDWVLLRRTRDNILTVCNKDHAGLYEGHVIEPVDEDETPKAKVPAAPKAKAPKAKVSAAEETPNPDDQAGSGDANPDEA